ncbi:hypothetical protein GCM10007920_01400 [Ciceribacter naphthalenivorans]|uniref:Uncharacterized protein n=2 Tax=Alphaproteobacteria TaxID=28211 RepID=A0A512HCR9_9HYPH|nr:hypothetical protein RNA01_01810 [Ciceribacter naphthalenivorans]GLR20356.1 hypothetical protein GCM10007920_01400 [Ciceribacter naphthalenivorans]GLT03212.1 hypothetical protein GCM10007926_01400 [Sphingomonas psychrolutea]
MDVARAFAEKERLQGLIDAAVLAAAGTTDKNARFAIASAMLSKASDEPLDIEDVLLAENADGSLTGTYSGSIKTNFLQLAGLPSFDLKVSATALASEESAASTDCIYVLASQGQDVLINSGANIYSKTCRVNVHSKASPAFIMNSGAKIDTAKFCVKGTNYIKNGGTLSNLEVGCTPAADPYAGTLPEPMVSSSCTTSGTMDGQRITLKPGVHCATTFNGSPTITFQPGLHIIKGRMIINSGATVNAQGVSFYFPDVNSEIRANGELTFTATAPTTGTYKGLLMFEKTSDASNNANKQQYIFNGSKGEILEGIIYLPNRNVTYNSTTNQVNRITLVVNQMIMNSSNWLLEPYTSGSSTPSTGAYVRLIQ